MVFLLVVGCLVVTGHSWTTVITPLNTNTKSNHYDHLIGSWFMIMINIMISCYISKMIINFMIGRFFSPPSILWSTSISPIYVLWWSSSKNIINMMIGRFFSRPSPPSSSLSPLYSFGPRSSGTESSEVNSEFQRSEIVLNVVKLISKEWNKLECLKKWCPESHTEEELVQADSILPQSTGPYGQLVPQSTGPSSQLVLPVNWSHH